MLRCLLEIFIKKEMAYNAEMIHKWCKLVENRLIEGESPLRQFCRENWMGYNNFKIRKIHKEGFLSGNLVNMVEEKDMTVDTIR